MQPGIEIYSIGIRIIRHAIKFTCQKCEIIKFRKKNRSEEPNSANYRMRETNLSSEEHEKDFRI